VSNRPREVGCNLSELVEWADYWKMGIGPRASRRPGLRTWTESEVIEWADELRHNMLAEGIEWPESCERPAVTSSSRPMGYATVLGRACRLSLQVYDAINPRLLSRPTYVVEGFGARPSNRPRSWYRLESDIIGWA
jgi:hypothetical protein